MFRHCRKQQAKFDKCVLDELGWVRPDLGELSKVRFLWVGERGLAVTTAEGVPLRMERL